MMGNNDSKVSAALVVGVIALVLSVYSSISVTQFNQEHDMDAGLGTTEKNFDQEVKRVIEDYVAEQTGQPSQPAPSNEPVDVSEGSGIVKGDDDAPITMVEFSDYQCPFCKKFFDETMPQLQKDYIDTGKVRYVFRDFPLSIHPRAIPAANAARCVLDQGDLDDYWAYHDLIFQNQSDLSDEALKTYAGQIQGIDAEELTVCMQEGRFNDDVQADFAEGQEVGVTGTPAFFINGRMVRPAGALPYASFKQIIDAELEQLGE